MIVLRSDIKNWNNAYDFISNFFLDRGAKKTDVTKVCIAAEEIFVNVCSYAYGKKTGDVEIKTELVNDEAMVTITDDGIEFDPTDAEVKVKAEVEVGKSFSERRIGGMGILVAGKVVDKISYKRENRRNGLKIIKKLTGGIKNG